MTVTDKMIKAYSKAMRAAIHTAIAEDEAETDDMNCIVKAAIASGIEAAIAAMEPPPVPSRNIGLRFVPVFADGRGTPLSVSLPPYGSTLVRMAAVLQRVDQPGTFDHIDISLDVAVL